MTLHTGSSPKLNAGSSRKDVIPEDVGEFMLFESLVYMLIPFGAD